MLRYRAPNRDQTYLILKFTIPLGCVCYLQSWVRIEPALQPRLVHFCMVTFVLSDVCLMS